MTANCNDMANHLSLHTDITLGLRFGQVQTLTPIYLGAGHRPVIKVRYRGGLVIEYSPHTAIELARRFPEALAYLPAIPDCSGAVVDLEGTA